MKSKRCSHAPDGRPNPRRQMIDARGVATRRATREFGVLADRLYFGARGICKTGVQHFHV